jgi:XTP/dITP diphosphohydrolase
MRWRLLVATNNPHKLRELQQIAALLAPGELEFFAPEVVLGVPWEGVEESGRTLEENAYLKARALFERVWQPVVADDSGLEVEALGGRPGVDSAHFVGSDAENRRAVLELLRGVPVAQRRARFRTVLCYCDQFRTVCVEGVVEGWIAESERGSHGFGYDAIFVPEESERTFAEMEPEEKNRRSHRARAVAALVEYLRRLDAPEVTAQEPEEVHLPAWLPELMRLCAAAASQSPEVERYGEEALRAGVPPQALHEALLQSALFAGFPAAIEALQTVAAVCRRYGFSWEDAAEEGFGEAGAAERRERGRELFAKVYGEYAERVRERLRAGSPALEELVLRVAYGEVLSRPGLGLLEREWAAVAVLGVGGWWRQLRSHLRALRRLGVSAAQGEALLAVLQPFCSAPQWERLMAEWQHVGG